MVIVQKILLLTVPNLPLLEFCPGTIVLLVVYNDDVLLGFPDIKFDDCLLLFNVNESCNYV